MELYIKYVVFPFFLNFNKIIGKINKNTQLLNEGKLDDVILNI